MQFRVLCAALLTAMALALAICGLGIAAVPAPVQVTDAWIRWLPAGLPAGGYATLHNTGAQPQLLTGASSPDYESVSLHQTLMHGQMSAMQPVAQIPIAPGATVSFAAGGYHIMLEHAKRGIVPGDHVAITLHFAGGASVQVPFEVRKPSAPPSDSHDMPDMPDMPGMTDMPGMQHQP